MKMRTSVNYHGAGGTVLRPAHRKHGRGRRETPSIDNVPAQVSDRAFPCVASASSADSREAPATEPKAGVNPMHGNTSPEALTNKVVNPASQLPEMRSSGGSTARAILPCFERGPMSSLS